MGEHTPSPWEWQNSNSWWRLGTPRGDGFILRPAVAKDGHPTLDFPSGGPTGRDARILESAPDLYEAASEAFEYFMREIHHDPTDTALNLVMNKLTDALGKARGENR